MNCRIPFLVTGVFAAGLGFRAAPADVITFDGMDHGRILNTQIEGVTISAINPNRVHDLAAVFDTSLSGTADPDLEGPLWSGGNLASNLSGDGTQLGGVLIIAENDIGAGDGILDDPDDEGSRPAGTLSLLFDTDLISLGFDLIDIEDVVEEAGAVEFYLDNAFVGAVDFSDFVDPLSAFYDPTVEFGDNTANRIAPIAISQVGGELFDEVRFQLGGSGAVDNIDFTVVPAPGALSLLGVAGLLGCRRRRRRA